MNVLNILNVWIYDPVQFFVKLYAYIKGKNYSMIKFLSKIQNLETFLILLLQK